VPASASRVRNEPHVRGVASIVITERRGIAVVPQIEDRGLAAGWVKRWFRRGAGRDPCPLGLCLAAG